MIMDTAGTCNGILRENDPHWKPNTCLISINKIMYEARQLGIQDFVPGTQKAARPLPDVV